MKNTAIKLISTALATVTALSGMLTAACAADASVSVTGAKAPSEINRVIVDCRNAEAFAKTSAVHVHIPTNIEPDPYTGGKYSFSEALNAMQIEYNDSAPKDRHFRILTKLNKSNNLTSEYKYMTVVYAAKTSQSYSLSVWNGGSQGPEDAAAYYAGVDLDKSPSEYGENTVIAEA